MSRSPNASSPAGRPTSRPATQNDTARTPLDWLLFAASALLLAVLAGALVWAGVPADEPAVRPHPEHGSVLQATGPESASLVGWGLAFGLATLALMTVCILLGVRKAGAVGTLGRRLALGCAVLAALFTALVWTYVRPHDLDSADAFVGGFPPATAWMIYGIWWFPGLMLLAMSLAFRRTWLTDEQVDAFRALLARRAGEEDA